MGISARIEPTRPFVDLPRTEGVSGSELRAAIGHFATGVTVVTSARPDSRPFGSTANAVTSVSLDPPLVLVCLRQESETLAALLEHRRFAVNVLGDGQHTIARHFAQRSSADLWESVRHSRSAHGVPLIDDAVAILECVLHGVSDGGDHRIVIGRVLSVEHPAAYAPPLVFYRGEFARLDSPATEPPRLRSVPPAKTTQDPTGPAVQVPARPPLAAELPNVFVPTPNGDMQLLAVNQEDRPTTSVIALIGAPRGSQGSLVYLHRGCLLGDALGHLHCPRRLALQGALSRIREQGTGVVVYHRDDSSPFDGCCLASGEAPVASSHYERSLEALRHVVQELRLREVRLLSSPTDSDPLPASLLGLQVGAVEQLVLEDQPAPAGTR